jgi:hypothetical protein
VGQKPRPLVLTLGWLGANERHLGKYSSWYSSQGYDTLSFISPATSMYALDNANRYRHQMLTGCCVSCVVSRVLRVLRVLRVVCRVSCVVCRVSCVVCRVSCVVCSV